MIKTLYEKFQPWSAKGSIYLISDTHFDDIDCHLMDKNWITPEEHLQLINKFVHKNDTLIHLGDVGNKEWMKQIKGYKVLITGNHDQGAETYKDVFNEIYNGPLFISNKILLSHEPLISPFWYNIHGHDHNPNNLGGINDFNIASNVIGYDVINLQTIINAGVLKNISDIHRYTIDHATENNKIKKPLG